MSLKKNLHTAAPPIHYILTCLCCYFEPPPSGGRRCVRLHCLNRAHRKGERADVMLIKVESGEEESAAWMLKLTHTHTQAQTIIGWIRTVQISFMCGHTHTLSTLPVTLSPCFGLWLHLVNKNLHLAQLQNSAVLTRTLLNTNVSKNDYEIYRK